MIFPFSVSRSWKLLAESGHRTWQAWRSCRWSYHSPLNIQPPGSYRADISDIVPMQGAIGRDFSDFSACVRCVRQIAVCFGLYLLTSLDIQTCGEIHSSVLSNMLCLVQMARAGNLSLACTTPHCSFWSRLKSWTCQQFNPIFLNANEPNQIKPHGSQFNSKILRPNGWYKLVQWIHVETCSPAGVDPKKSLHLLRSRSTLSDGQRKVRHFMNF